jgi:NADPH-dependent 2,4-dienoyl-CoA reductase/sulfur reductase-like enzyme
MRLSSSGALPLISKSNTEPRSALARWVFHRFLLSTSVPAGEQTVTSVDTNTKTVALDGGKEIIPYDTLILASGGVPRRLPIEGADLENVYTLRRIQDAQLIDSGIISPVFMVA